jgi:hypothetical protein
MRGEAVARTKVSHSKLMAFQICGEYGRRKYVEGDYRPGTLRMHRGSSVAEIAAEGHRRQFEAKKLGLSTPIQDLLFASLPSEAEARDLAATAFDKRVTEGVVVAKEDIQEAGSQKQAIGNEKDVAVDMAGFYTSRMAPTINPIGFEQRILINPRDSDVSVDMILDLVEEGPPETPDGPPTEIVADLKTSQKSPAHDLAEKDQQLPFYAMGRQAVTGKLPDAEVLRYVVRTPKKHDLKRVELRTKVTQGDINTVVHRINALKEAMDKGVFIPAAPNHWKCSSRACEFWSDCRFAMKRT